MSTISTITELLTLSNCQFRIYEIGRKVDKLSKETFNKVELNQLPYPSPIQGFAQFSIVFWQKKSKQPYLWFIKLPLDERGLFNQGARNHFIAIITEALGSDLSVDPTEKQEELLKSNPYIFTPSQYKLAFINSLISIELKHSPSKYYLSFKEYLQEKNWSNWQHIGVQGLNDFSVRLHEENNELLLNNALENLPLEVLSPLLAALENTKLPLNTINKVLASLTQAFEQKDDNKAQILLRSLASSITHPLVDEYIENLLAREEMSTELLICLSGRCWQYINNNARALQFLELLIKDEDIELFIAIFKDLVAISSIRPHILHCLRSTERSEALSKAIGHLFNAEK